MRLPRIVATDLDGTLLDPTGRISDRTAKAIDLVKAAGALFVVVTGRPHRWLRPMASDWELTGTAICANGSITYDIDADEIVEFTAIEAGVASHVVERLRVQFPRCRVGVERIGACGDTHPTTSRCVVDVLHHPFVAEPGFSTPWTDSDHMTTPAGTLLDHPAVKLLVRDATIDSHSMADIASELLGNVVEISVSSNGGLIDVSPAGATKAAALARYAQRHRVDLDDVIAFGDMHNDLPMLTWSGYSVAMGQAPEQVKAAADEVTTTNAEDGVARVLERWFP